MNYIIDKESKSVLWINTDPNKLEGKFAWSQFDSSAHQIVYALHYNPRIGEQFKADLDDGVAREFESKKVYHKITGVERILQSWEDEIDPETETSKEPLTDPNGNSLPYQQYTPSGWVVDENQRREALLSKNKQIFNAKIEFYRGRVEFAGTVWDSGRQYLENIRKTLILYSKQKINSIPDWRDANDAFNILSSDELSDLADRIELDLFQAGQALYSKKWEIESKIQSLRANEALDLSVLWS